MGFATQAATKVVGQTNEDAKEVSFVKCNSFAKWQEFGGKFISYDMEKWIFRVPHFNR